MQQLERTEVKFSTHFSLLSIVSHPWLKVRHLFDETLPVDVSGDGRQIKPLQLTSQLGL